MSLNERDVPFLFLICGIGFASVSLVLALLYTHAYRKREESGLNDWERLVTRLSIAPRWRSDWPQQHSLKWCLHLPRAPLPGLPTSRSPSSWSAGCWAAEPGRGPDHPSLYRVPCRRSHAAHPDHVLP